MASESDAEVPDPDHPRIVVDEQFGGEPRLRGRRITVLDVYDGVESGESTPGEFAERFDLPVADVHHALAYYHDHSDEMAAARDARERTAENVRDRVRQERPEFVHTANG